MVEQTLTDPYGRDLFDAPLDQIPLTTDRLPYAQLGALGKYRDQTLPDTSPPVLAELFASTSTFVGDLLSTDGKRNLNVNLKGNAAGVGGSSLRPLARSPATIFTLADGGTGVTGPLTNQTPFPSMILVSATMTAFGSLSTAYAIMEINLRDTHGNFFVIGVLTFGAVGQRADFSLIDPSGIDVTGTPLVGSFGVYCTSDSGAFAGLQWIA